MRKIPVITSIAIFLIMAGSIINAQEMNNEAGKLYNAGNEKLKAGNYGAAITNYDEALKIQQDYRIYYQKGIALKKSGNLANAKSAFETCIKLKPDYEGSYNALGGVLFSMGNLNDAITNFQKVLELSKNNSVKNTVKKNLSKAYTKLGAAEISSGSSANAIEYLTKAVEYDNYDAAYLSLAKLYSETGNYDKSISAAENAMKYRSSITKGGPYYYMGVAYKFKGDMTKAKEMFNNAKVDPSYKKTAEYELSALK